MGFTLSYGSIFSKTWRVHVLLTNKRVQRKVGMNDYDLMNTRVYKSQREHR